MPKKFVTKIILLLIFLLYAPNIYSFTKYSHNPIYTSEFEQNWDIQSVGLPSVIIKDSTYYMWFSGFDSTLWKIGLATSSDGINWSTNLNNPLLSDNNGNGWSHDPTVIYNNGIFEMWYVNNFAIKKAISIDGVVWSMVPNSDFKPNVGWGSSMVSSPFVLKINNSYHMWFVGINSSGIWNIGYASSQDGVSWENYQNNPVLVKTQSWEGLHTDSPHVIFDGNTYEMYYNTGANISYAKSIDGINWSDKPSIKNPVLIPEQPFESIRLYAPSVLDLSNGTRAIWYTGINNNSGNTIDGKIGLAADGPLPSQEPSPTPLPTLIPTLTPTPIPPSVNKVVVVPGLGASWNADAIINCKVDNYQGDWDQMFYVDLKNFYNYLYSTLNNNGYQALPFYYDWRKDPRETAVLLNKFINSNTETDEKVYLVGHSLGGMVSRALIEYTQSSEKVEKLLTVGSPHQGAPLAYGAWAGGDIHGNTLWNIALNAMVLLCLRSEHPLHTNKYIIQNVAPSVQTLLPTFDYLYHKKDKSFINVANMQNKNNWLPNTLFQSPFYDIQVGTLNGNNQNTISGYNVKDYKAKNPTDLLWLDGKPFGKTLTSNLGDGTVLNLSSALTGADNRYINQDHLGIIASETGISEILDFLGIEVSADQLAQIQDPQPVSALLVISADQTEFEIEDEKGQKVKSKQSMSAIINPESKSYRILIEDQETNTFIIMYVLSNGNVKFKELKKEPKSKKRFDFIINQDNIY